MISEIQESSAEGKMAVGVPLPAAYDEAATMSRIKDLPKDLGVMLVTIGGLGLVLPGLVGAPALVAGGLVLWPKAFTRVEGWLRRQSPSLHSKSIKQLGRFLDDLERHYPTPPKS